MVALRHERYSANGRTVMAGSPRIRSLSKALIFSLAVSILVSVTGHADDITGHRYISKEEQMKGKSAVSAIESAAGFCRLSASILEIFDRTSLDAN